MAEAAEVSLVRCKSRLLQCEGLDVRRAEILFQGGRSNRILPRDAQQSDNAETAFSATTANATVVFPGGVVTYENATFTTACSYEDPACMQTCTSYSTACSRSWITWSKTGASISLNTNKQTTETITWHSYTQNLTAISGYTYALGPDVAVTSSTIILTAAAPEDITISTWAPTPTCSMPTWSCNSGCNSRTCEVQGGTVELLFWPTATASTGQHTNASIAGAAPATATYKGMVLTSPSVYIEFKTAYALDGCSQTVGGTYPGAIIAVNPDELYSINAELDYLVSTVTISEQPEATTYYQSRKVDYADLTGLPPGEAYNNMPMCVPVGCGVITPSFFHPQLVVPTQVRGLDPAWSSCGLDWRGSWDPPMVLHAAPSAAPVTSSREVEYTSTAVPQMGVSGPATQTAVPTTVSTGIAGVSTGITGPTALSEEHHSASTSGVSSTTVPMSVPSPLASFEVGTTTAIADPDPSTASFSIPAGSQRSSVASQLTETKPVAGETTSIAFDGSVTTTNAIPLVGSPVSAESDTAYIPVSVSTLVIGSTSSQPINTGSPTNAYEVLTAALPPSSTAVVAIVTNPAGNLHTIAQQPDGYIFDSATTIQPGHAATVSGLGLVSAGSDGQVYDLASSGSVSAGANGAVHDSVGINRTTAAASLPGVMTESGYLPSVITRTVTRDAATSGTQRALRRR
ncbi:hypothetical protein LTR95_002077 [Oleoguttula sp. CCFEE 5521]